MEPADRYQGGMLGLACGDAKGKKLDCKPRGAFEPITDMVGGRPFNLEPGQLTDDTSMALCLAESLIEKNGFDSLDQMGRYVSWYGTGYLSGTGICFDIGGTSVSALRRFEKTRNPFSGPTGNRSAGNGSQMHLSPLPLFFFPERDAMIFHVGESSWATHGAQECIDACRFFASILHNALSGMDRERVLSDHDEAEIELLALREILRGSYTGKTEDQINSTGYVAKSLDDALRCFCTTNTFMDAVLKAANLGDDADTTVAI